MRTKVASIEERNRRVEADKAWEISKTRRTAIVILTYFVIVIFLYLIDASSPWLMALVPAIGYLLSTLLVMPLKNWWLRNLYDRKNSG
jgi:polyferredoxin